MQKQMEVQCGLEKQRIRNEIEAQVTAYIKQGGKIDVLPGLTALNVNTIGSIWNMESNPLQNMR
ncbi:MAG: hypothetical protein ACJAZE_001561 [Halioglobus sp.]|jgi:hypothetical protein